MKKIEKGRLAFAVIWIPLVLSSCAPDSGLNSVAEYDVVVALYDRQADFGAIQTFTIPDSVVHLIDPDFAGKDDVNREYDDLILSEVTDNLLALGYTEESDPGSSTPDVFVAISVTSSDWVVYEWYPYYWDYYWGWYPYWPGWGPGWGVGYPYYGTVAYYTYSTGTILIQMLSVEGADEGSKEVPIIWLGAVNGVITGSSQEIENRIKVRIKQCFNQSPYLGAD